MYALIDIRCSRTPPVDTWINVTRSSPAWCLLATIVPSKYVHRRLETAARQPRDPKLDLVSGGAHF